MTTAGLEGIVVAETALSDIDGEQGRFAIRGYPIEELVRARTFEEVCELLWHARLPEGAERSRLERGLGQARAEAFQRLETLGDALEAPAPMDALRAALAHLFMSSSGDRPDFTTITASVAVYGAAWARRRAGQPLVPPDPGLPHAADYLRAVTGEAPSEAPARALDAYLVTVAEHGMNASTFAARVVASTGSDAVSAVVSAVGALKGPLHGGAPG
ncbi:MAG: citrate synthase/methylcitrate synthase, partial [Actinomycetota bacterium]|nr:citrate synthase/methylcitrate synthase [Actinomycetota bacterium]